MSNEQYKDTNRFQLLMLLQGAEEGASIPLLVTGMSMLPFLFHKRSIVFLKKDSSYAPRKWDIVLFVRNDTSVVLHRIVKIKKDGTLVIKGDAQRWREEIHPEQILAYVTDIQRRERRFSVDHPYYRFMLALWMPLRLIHPPLGFFIHLLNRIPFKLSRKYRETHS